jgi:hypothetical protein
MHSHYHQLPSVPGHNARHPFHLNDPQEEQENLHTGDYFPRAQVIILVFISSKTLLQQGSYVS